MKRDTDTYTRRTHRDSARSGWQRWVGGEGGPGNGDGGGDMGEGVGSRAFILRLSIRIQCMAPALPREDKGVISARRGEGGGRGGVRTARSSSPQRIYVPPPSATWPTRPRGRKSFPRS